FILARLRYRLPTYTTLFRSVGGPVVRTAPGGAVPAAGTGPARHVALGGADRLAGELLGSGRLCQRGLGVGRLQRQRALEGVVGLDRKSTRLHSSHVKISYDV